MISKCFTIAGSDSGGGAGIQADLKVFHSLDCFGSSAITCLTAQNTQTVQSIFPVPPCFVGEQIEAVLEDIGSHCIKLGMLLNSEIIDIVASKLMYYKPLLNFKIVIDPVMVSKSGMHLLEPAAVENFIQKLIPLADILTPNLPEASVLLNRKIATQNEMLQAAKDLVALGAKAVVIKGGHLEDLNSSLSSNSDDVLFYKLGEEEFVHWLPAKRILTKNTHGTGCTFSAAICSFLAKNRSVLDAVTQAKKFITTSLNEGKEIFLGKGYGPAKF